MGGKWTTVTFPSKLKSPTSAFYFKSPVPPLLLLRSQFSFSTFRLLSSLLLDSQLTAISMGKGKQKIDIKHITNKSKRRITFSKRRQGLFKKAVELDTLCGSHTSVVSVSDAGTIFTAGSIHPSLIHQLLLPHGLRGLEKLGLEELWTILATLKKAQESVELLLEKKEKEEEEEKAGATSKDPTFAYGATTTFSSEVSSFGCSGGDGCYDFGAFSNGYADIEDLLMGDGFDDAGSAFSSTPGSEEELNSFESELMYLL